MVKSIWDDSTFIHCFRHCLLDQINLPLTTLAVYQGNTPFLHLCGLRAHRDGGFTVWLRTTSVLLCSHWQEPEPPQPHITSHCLCRHDVALSGPREQEALSGLDSRVKGKCVKRVEIQGPVTSVMSWDLLVSAVSGYCSQIGANCSAVHSKTHAQSLLGSFTGMMKPVSTLRLATLTHLLMNPWPCQLQWQQSRKTCSRPQGRKQPQLSYMVLNFQQCRCARSIGSPHRVLVVWSEPFLPLANDRSPFENPLACYWVTVRFTHFNMGHQNTMLSTG